MRDWVFTVLLSVILHAAAFAGANGEQILYNGKIFTGEAEDASAYDQ